MNEPLPFSLYNNDMDTPSSYTNRFRQLRWKLTVSYTGVTVGALLTVELILLASTAIFVAVLLNSGVIQTELINAVHPPITCLRCSFYYPGPHLSKTISTIGWIGWVPRLVQPFHSPLMLLTKLFLVGHDGVFTWEQTSGLIWKRYDRTSSKYAGSSGIGCPLQAALGGEEDVDNLYSLPGSDGNVIMPSPFGMRRMKRCLACWLALANFQRSGPRSAALFLSWESAFLSSRLLPGSQGRFTVRLPLGA